MGRLKSMALNVHAEQCYEGEEEQMPCCKDVSEELKVEDFTPVGFDFDATPELFELAIVNFVVLQEIDFRVQSEKPHFQHYSPPLPDQDIPVLIQSFLI